jgi:hypothetical protein
MKFEQANYALGIGLETYSGEITATKLRAFATKTFRAR